MVDTAAASSQMELYHAGVLILLYSDLMILAMIVFLALMLTSVDRSSDFNFQLANVAVQRVAWYELRAAQGQRTADPIRTIVGGRHVKAFVILFFVETLSIWQ